jgi:molybdopterin molybdotransferase
MALLTVAEALSRVTRGLEPLEPERVPLEQARGRVLAEDIAAHLTQPPFDASAMDGYAVRAQDVRRVPADLAVAGESSAGTRFKGRLAAGQAVRIFTGAPLPAGADSIVIQENTTRDGPTVTVLEPVREGRFVRRQGLDFEAGEVLLGAGTRVGAREVSLAASMNHAAVPVRRRPVVAILPTGDELVMPGQTPRDDQIIASNNFGLAAIVEHGGGTARDLGIAGDRKDVLAAAIARARDADVLVTIGGASVGDHDLVHAALLDAGMQPGFWRIAMRPGKPLMFGRMGRVRVLGLPGNPVSSFVCAYLFLMPLLAALTGRTGTDDGQRARLAIDVPANDARQDYLRAALSRSDDGSLLATPFLEQDSSMMRMLARADCLLVRPPNDPARPAGHPVTVLPLDF